MKPPIGMPWWGRVGVGIAALAATVVLAGPGRGPDYRNFPVLKFPKLVNGSAAVNALGAHLPNLAQAYGFDPFALRLMLTTDLTLALDQTGRLHYREPVIENGGSLSTASVPQIQTAIVPLINPLKLHSRPGAKRIIYLDFCGRTMANNAWTANNNMGNPINAPAWSLDADATTFNNAEIAEMKNIWQRVAEDYAPFDVDVTTELTSEDQITRTDANDQYYGTRALISPISSYFGNYGGIAYVGVFDSVGDYYKPALVFPENLGPNGESYIAEAISHEVGHNFGLSHDGTSTAAYYSGQGNWAPIMGVGYYVSLVQWSKGEYTDANNKEDDLAIISSYVGYRPDDHGNTAATATYFPAGTQLSAAGVITSSTDVDVFAFATGTGNVVINLNPDSISPDLDILAELRDSAGNLIATSNPIGALTASFNLNLNSGTYFIHVRGTGEGSPTATGYSSYASIGQYTITGTVVVAGPQPPVAVATATPSTAIPNQNITFTGTGSFDPDGGAIVLYNWSFSDGTTTTAATGATVTKAFASSGSFTATLTVTDEELTTSSTSIPFVINNPPVAVISVSGGTSFYAQSQVTFNGGGSTDSDGTISSYAWDFGDGTTGTGASVYKTYNSVGNYTVKLTITDNLGATGMKTVAISVIQNPALVIRVNSVVLLSQTVPGGKTVRATIKVTNPSGTAISGVTVSGKWTGIVAGTGSAVTDSSGTAVLTSSKTKSSGSETLSVTGLSRSGYVYDATKNLASGATISVP